MATEIIQKTEQRTFPNTFVCKQHLGGFDNTSEALNNDNILKQMLAECGVANNIEDKVDAPVEDKEL